MDSKNTSAEQEKEETPSQQNVTALNLGDKRYDEGATTVGNDLFVHKEKEKNMEAFCEQIEKVAQQGFDDQKSDRKTEGGEDNSIKVGKNDLSKKD